MEILFYSCVRIQRDAGRPPAYRVGLTVSIARGYAIVSMIRNSKSRKGKGDRRKRHRPTAWTLACHSVEAAVLGLRTADVLYFILGKVHLLPFA